MYKFDFLEEIVRRRRSVGRVAYNQLGRTFSLRPSPRAAQNSKPGPLASMAAVSLRGESNEIGAVNSVRGASFLTLSSLTQPKPIKIYSNKFLP